MLMRVVAHFAKLAVEMILHEVVVEYIRFIGCYECLYLTFVVDGKLSPPAAVSGMETVAEHRPRRIGAEPVFVALHKLLVFGRLAGIASLLGIDLAEIGVLEAVDSFVVDLGESVEARRLGGIPLAVLLVLYSADGFETHIHRMESESGVGAVGVGVGPSAGLGGVVDREHLHYLLACEHTPVYHLLQIVEIAYAVVFVGAEREHGNRRACALP